MSRSIFQMNTDHHYNEILPTSTQSSTINTLIHRNNPRFKRNLRDKRRSTGIRPNDVSLAGTSTENSTNENEGEEEKEEEQSPLTELNDTTRTLTTYSSIKSNITVNRIQSSLENLSVSLGDFPIKPSLSNQIFRSDDICLYPQTLDNNDSSTIENQHLEERIRILENLLDEKIILIEDLQEKLNKITRNFHDAEEQISKLHQDKLTLIKALANIQETKRSPNMLMRK